MRPKTTWGKSKSIEGTKQWRRERSYLITRTFPRKKNRTGLCAAKQQLAKWKRKLGNNPLPPQNVMSAIKMERQGRVQGMPFMSLLQALYNDKSLREKLPKGNRWCYCCNLTAGEEGQGYSSNDLKSFSWVGLCHAVSHDNHESLQLIPKSSDALRKKTFSLQIIYPQKNTNEKRAFTIKHNSGGLNN